MRARAAGAVFAAVLAGGLLAFGIAHGLGWTGGTTTTVQPVYYGGTQTKTPAAVVSAAKPLAGNGFDPARIFAGRSPGVVTIIADFANSTLGGAESQGSGFVVSPEGYILTNSHVITDSGESPNSVSPADTLYVEFADRDRVKAKVVGWDVFDDVGLLKIDPAAHPLQPVPLGDSSKVVVGQPVAAIGSPFGNENSLSVGVVSATKRAPDSLTAPHYSLVDAIQIDAPINHGNSGGPLFDAHGRVIGITAQIRSDSGNAEGVGFVVPINSARRSMNQLIAKGEVDYAFVGVQTVDLTPTIAGHYGLPVKYGAAVDWVRPGSPAQKAGLRAGRVERFNDLEFPRGGDVIVGIDGRAVRNKEDVVRVVTERLEPGQTTSLAIVRDGKRQTVSIKLAARKRNP